MNDTILNTILIVGTTFLFVALIIPYVKKMAIHINAIDKPNDRKVHKGLMPRLGGLGIFLGFLVGYMAFGEPSVMMNAILIGSIILIIVGIVDDIKPIKAKTKLIGQIASASVVAFYGNILLDKIDAFGFYLNFGLLAYPLTVLFIISFINAVNLIDGLDGLSGGVSAIYFLTIGIISIIGGSFGLDYVLTFVMLGSTLGFLVHNFHPAKIFAGDTGSMFFGFMIAVIALLGFKNVTLTSLVVPLVVMAIPILDTLFAILRRKLKGESISSPDKSHIHHQFLDMNVSKKNTVLIIYGINILFAIASIIYISSNKILGYVVYSVLTMLVVVFVLKTNVIFDKEKLREKLSRLKK